MGEGYRMLEARVRDHALARQRRRQHVRDFLIGAAVGAVSWPIVFVWLFS